MYKKEIRNILIEAIKKAGYKKPTGFDLQTPKNEKWGDYTTNTAFIVKKEDENPKQVAQKILKNIKKNDWLNVSIDNSGYINFIIHDEKLIDNLSLIVKEGDKYGSSDVGKGETVVIDYSSPNIAKPFSVGHFRATIIGQTIYNIYKFLGYKVIGDNHIGDWGTQFGKMIVAYKEWGDRSKIEKDPIRELYNLYVKFHQVSKESLGLNDEAKKWFKKLEDGDQEARDIWKWMVELSMDEFTDIYDILGVKFDEILGESFYEDKMDIIIEKCEKKKLALWGAALDKDGKPQRDEKVLLVDLTKEGIDVPVLLKKSDGATLYATRDLATAEYRIKKWNPAKILYAVGNEQKLYFKQIFKVLKMMGQDENKFKHINFGFIRLADGRMSTRAGRTIFIKDVISESTKRAKKFMQDDDISEYDKEKIAKIVGIGALKYADLSQNRTQDMVFNYDKMLALKGNSGPYLQYTYARAKSILRKVGKENIEVDDNLEVDEVERIILRKLSKFNEVVENAAQNYMPNYIANYLFELANDFNGFYQTLPILKAEENKKQLRLAIVASTAQVLKNGLNLLGIETLEKM